jgi:outer membrane protein assembly factor BamE (lipoprotein component of BamABCDE complex)
MKVKIKGVGVIVGAMLVAACAPVVYSHGNSPNPQLLELIEPNVQDKSQVLAMLGSPSSVTMFEEETWLYISSKSQQKAFFEPEELERKVIAITFNAEGKVSGVAKMLKEDGLDIEFSTKETPTSGHSFTFMEQLFGNVGRFEGKK